MVGAVKKNYKETKRGTNRNQSSTYIIKTILANANTQVSENFVS